MSKILVYLQYPWGISDSQYYKNILEYPPKDIIYVGNKKIQGMITNKKYMFLANFLKKLIRNITHKLKLIILNIHKTPSNQKFDLIHCAHCLSSNDSPWIADFESAWQMWISGRDSRKGREKILKILQNKNCKKIIAWTKTGKKEILKKYPEIKEKVDIVPHAIPFHKFKKKKSKKIRLLFIGRYFKGKGGLHTLEAFDRLTKKYKNVEAIMVSPVPDEIIKKYSKNDKIKLYGLISYDKIIKKIFPSSDIYVCPGYSDTFGFPFIEALAFGTPVITVDGFSRKDIIDNNQTGFVIKRTLNSEWYPSKKEGNKIIAEIVEKTSILIENKKLRNKMSKNCIKTIKTGKFSIKERNKKLKNIYEEALRSNKDL